jgi:ERCC4-type nuclease
MEIIRDTREQSPWLFSFYEDVTVKIGTLKTGDYTLSSHKDILCIERKKNTGEIAQNIGRKKAAFLAELQRMEKFQYRHLICEFPKDMLYSFPAFSGIPVKVQKFVRIHKNYLISFMDKITLDFGVSVHYCDNSTHAESVAYNIMLGVYNEVK